MADQEDPADFSVKSILAAHGRKVMPNSGPGRHSWTEVNPGTTGTPQHRLEEDDLEEETRQSQSVWWRRWLANYGLIPPVTASR